MRSLWIRALAVAALIVSNGLHPKPVTAQPAEQIADTSPAYRPGVVLVGVYPEALGASGLLENAGGAGLLSGGALQPAVEALQQQLGEGALTPLFTAPLARHDDPRPAFADGKLLAGSAAVFELALAGGSVEDAVARLKDNPAVAFAEPDYLAAAAAVPNDPRYAEQWGLAKIQAAEAWDMTQGSESTIIAVIDSGVLAGHEDLAARLWVNPLEIPGNGIDDDQNGYVDDVHGANVLAGNGLLTDSTGHGTQVAGVAAAATNNAKGIAGTCPNCKLMIVKVIGDGATANYSDIAKGIDYAVRMGAKVINLSLGGYSDSQALRAAVQAAAQTAVVVASAGNDGGSAPFYPAAYSDWVAAAAGTASDDSKIAASNYGDWVALAAPAENILTTGLGASAYTSVTGTSASAPFVAGLAGLLVSQNPGWSPLLVRQHMAHTADKIDALNPGLAGKLGGGRINARTAVRTAPRPNFSIVNYTAGGRLGGSLKADGGSITLAVTLGNDWLPAASANAVLSSTSPHVTIGKNSAAFTADAGGQRLNNTADAFQVSVAAGQYGLTLPFRITVTAGAYSQAVDFTLQSESQQVNVSGIISSSTTWLNSRTYRVNGNLTVRNNAVLTIQPGTVVRVDPGFFIKFEGGAALVADGTPDAQIVFAANSASNARWQGITFTGTALPAVFDPGGGYLSGSILRHVDVSNANYGVSMAGSAPYIAASRFASNVVAVHQTAASSPRIAGSTFENNETAINLYSGKPMIDSNTFIMNNTAIGRDGGMGALVPDIRNNFFDSNDVAIQQNDVWSEAGEFTEVIGNTIVNSKQTALTFMKQIVLRNNRILDNSSGVIANVIYADIQHNIIVNSNRSPQCLSDAPNPCTLGAALNLYIDSGFGSLLVAHNTIINNMGPGISVSGYGQGQLVLAHNNLFGNKGHDLASGYGGGGQVIDARNNYWGPLAPGEIGGRILDCNDEALTSCGEAGATRGEVLYDPVLAAPSQTAPAYVTRVTVDPQPVGVQQTATVTVQFSRPMDENTLPDLSFFDSRRGSVEVIGGTEGGGVMALGPDGSVWLGCRSSFGDLTTPYWGIRSFDGQRWKTYNTGSGLGSNFITALFVTSSGDVWAAHHGDIRLSRMRGGSWRTYFPSIDPEIGFFMGEIYSIGEDAAGNIWFAASEQIYRFDGAAWTRYTKAHLPLLEFTQQISAVARDGQGRMWFAHTGSAGAEGMGLSMFDGAAWHTYRPGSGLPPSTSAFRLDSLFSDSRGRIWFGMTAPTPDFSAVYSLGVVDNLSFRFFIRGKDGFPQINSWPRAIAEDKDGNIWFSSDNNYPATILVRYDGNRFTEYATKATSPLLFDRWNNLWFDTYDGSASKTMQVQWGGFDYAFEPGEWLDATTYRAAGFFNGSVPPGSYAVSAAGAAGLDGMAAYGERSGTFVVDYAGQVTQSAPPNTPRVVAGSLDGVPHVMKASWQVDDENKQVNSYRYAVGSTPGAADILYWTGTTQAQVERSGLPLVNGKTYWVSVQARNHAGLWSQTGTDSFIAGRNTILDLYLPAIRR